MDVNKTNYEEYMLDYLEGNLSVEVREKVKQFLQENPEIEEEISDLTKYVLPVEEMGYAQKSTLYREEKRRPIIPLFISGIAASIALLLGVVFFLNKPKGGEIVKQPVEQQTNSPQVADNTAVPSEEPNQQEEEATEEKQASSEPKKQKAVKKQQIIQPLRLAKLPVKKAKKKDNSEQKSIPFEPNANQEKRVESQNEFATVLPQGIEKNEALATDEKESKSANAQEDAEEKVIQKPTVIGEEALQAALVEGEEEGETPKTNDKQGVIDSIIDEIEFAENDPSYKDNGEDAEGFEIETIPTDDDLIVSTVVDNKKKGDDAEKSALTGKGTPLLDVLFKTDDNEIKDVILPKAFGFGVKKDKKEKEPNLKRKEKKSDEKPK